ncbi:hypothetical protein [Micrococcus porci]|uniref:hypothetical protein n=1 Tax=Micrococcus porci TaxID=2856555 RepID=UPI003CFA8DDE
MSALITLLALGLTTGLCCGVPYATMTELMPAHLHSTGIAIGYDVSVAVFGGSVPPASPVPTSACERASALSGAAAARRSGRTG